MQFLLLICVDESLEEEPRESGVQGGLDFVDGAVEDPVALALGSPRPAAEAGRLGSSG
jgi:hypothetical protein